MFRIKRTVLVNSMGSHRKGDEGEHVDILCYLTLLSKNKGAPEKKQQQEKPFPFNRKNSFPASAFYFQIKDACLNVSN